MSMSVTAGGEALFCVVPEPPSMGCREITMYQVLDVAGAGLVVSPNLKYVQVLLGRIRSARPRADDGELAPVRALLGPGLGGGVPGEAPAGTPGGRRTRADPHLDVVLSPGHGDWVAGRVQQRPGVGGEAHCVHGVVVGDVERVVGLAVVVHGNGPAGVVRGGERRNGLRQRKQQQGAEQGQEEPPPSGGSRRGRAMDGACGTSSGHRLARGGLMCGGMSRSPRAAWSWLRQRRDGPGLPRHVPSKVVDLPLERFVLQQARAWARAVRSRSARVV